jgi:Fe-coproporphyrin III synthase
MKMTRDMQLGEEGFLRKVVRPKRLESVFLFVTARCNSKCRTCFYAKETHPGEDMSFDQIRRISETAPKFDKLWLAGGEPVLRDDLVDIVETFYKNNDIRTMNFPTNGLLGDKIEAAVAETLERCPELSIHLNFSLDGLGETHDQIRGVPGAFAKTTATMDQLERRFLGHERLHRNVATVVTAENVDQCYDLGLYLLKRYRLATQYFEAVRGESRDPELKRATREQLEELHEKLMPLYGAMADRLFDTLPPAGRPIAKSVFVGTTRELYTMQRANLDGPHPWGMRCTAGETTFVIDHDGGIRSCELRPPIGNMADYSFDLRAALNSTAMLQEIDAIGGGERANCWCTHTCWMLSSMKFSPRKIAWDIPRGYIEARMRGSLEPKLDPAAIDLAELERRYHFERS